MKAHAFVFTSLCMISIGAHAVETLDADAVRKLISGNTAHSVSPAGAFKNYFSPDGKAVRHTGSAVAEGSWTVSDDGTHCLEGLPGGCAKIVRNDDGTYDRLAGGGKVLVKWTAVVKGRDF
jgi:hypothetical protein